MPLEPNMVGMLYLPRHIWLYITLNKEMPIRPKPGAPVNMFWGKTKALDNIGVCGLTS